MTGIGGYITAVTKSAECADKKRSVAMQKRRVVRNENMQQWLQTEGEMYLDLLKKGGEADA